MFEKRLTGLAGAISRPLGGGDSAKSPPMTSRFDLVVVGAGIVGLAHALAAIRRGLSVVVIDRESAADGASVRNFGFVTVTGQQAGACWRRALRSQRCGRRSRPRRESASSSEGLLVVAQRPEAMAVLEAFRATEMGAECKLHSAEETRRRYGEELNCRMLAGSLYSPHDRRVESREAVPRLARWLEEAKGVAIRRRCLVTAVQPGKVVTTAGEILAERVVVCSGGRPPHPFPRTHLRTRH